MNGGERLDSPSWKRYPGRNPLEKGHLERLCREQHPLILFPEYNKFLEQVIDETDRLLRQSYQDWLPSVLTHQQAVAGDGKELGGRSIVKIVASATLTQDPSKLQRLELHAPRYIAMSSTDNRSAVGR